MEDDDESVSPPTSKQMKITATNSFLHNMVRDYLNSPHHTILALGGHTGCSFTGLMFRRKYHLRTLKEMFACHLTSPFVTMLLLLFWGWSPFRLSMVL